MTGRDVPRNRNSYEERSARSTSAGVASFDHRLWANSLGAMSCTEGGVTSRLAAVVPPENPVRRARKPVRPAGRPRYPVRSEGGYMIEAEPVARSS